MTMTQDRSLLPDAANPFAEVFESAATGSPSGDTLGLVDDTESPFAEAAERPAPTETDRVLEAALAELRDEAFEEAIATLAGEVEEAVGERFSDEGSRYAPERAQLGQAILTPVTLAAETYLDRLIEGLTGTDIQSLDEDRLTELLDSFDPPQGEVTPLGEEFVGALVRKAKSVVRVVANTAKRVGQFAGRLIGPVLERLKALIRPLLRRVLAMAIGRLPAPLQAPARLLAARFTGETAEDELEEEASPSQPTDPAAISESFDLALAEAIVAGPDRQLQVAFLAEHEDGEDGQYREQRPLEQLADARGALIDRIGSAGDNENLEPEIEQFVPVLLGALRLGIRLVGRPKVVSFLARYVGQLISRWVGPAMSRPLSTAIVDTGLRLISLESPDGRPERDEAAAPMLAGVIEDTVRRLSEYEDYVFEDEELTQLAVAESFRKAVSTGFPARLVRPGLQQAPTLGGAFVGRRVRTVRAYRKYSRTPDIELTEQVADRLPSFSGTSVGAALRAAGYRLPMKVRLHLYEAMVGTSLPTLLRTDTGLGRLPLGRRRLAMVHPLTPGAAGLLLREPALGAAVPVAYTRTPFNVAVGQRFFVIEPLGAASATPVAATARGGLPAPSRVRLRFDRATRSLRASIYLAESDAQELATAIRAGRGLPAFLAAMSTALERPGAQLAPAVGGAVREVGEEEDEEHETLGLAPRRRLSRRRLRSWLLPALAPWFRANADAVARAAAHPSSGLTITAVVRLASGRRPQAGDVSLGVAPGRQA